MSFFNVQSSFGTQQCLLHFTVAVKCVIACNAMISDAEFGGSHAQLPKDLLTLVCSSMHSCCKWRREELDASL